MKILIVNQQYVSNYALKFITFVDLVHLVSPTIVSLW